jgi:plasmid stabilization system protein ParE
MKFVVRPAAAKDLQRAHEWYEAEREGLGGDFLEEVRQTIVRVAATPEAYAVVSRDTRKCLVRRFPYGVFFRILDEVVVIVACYHLRRRPASWKRRR